MGCYYYPNIFSFSKYETFFLPEFLTKYNKNQLYPICADFYIVKQKLSPRIRIRIYIFKRSNFVYLMRMWLVVVTR